MVNAGVKPARQSGAWSVRGTAVSANPEFSRAAGLKQFPQPPYGLVSSEPSSSCDTKALAGRVPYVPAGRRRELEPAGNKPTGARVSTCAHWVLMTGAADVRFYAGQLRMLACLVLIGISAAQADEAPSTSDRQITGQVKELISEHPEFGSMLTVQTRNGIVYRAVRPGRSSPSRASSRSCADRWSHGCGR